MPARNDVPPEERARRAALGEFLRERRERLLAADLGIRSNPLRRRRQPYPTQVELAQVAGIDRRTYQDLEAGTAHPSEAVLLLVATAMRLPADDVSRIYEMTGVVPAATARRSKAIELVETFATPAWVTDASATVVALNEPMRVLLPGLAEDGNVLTWVYCHDAARTVLVDFEEAALAAISSLRTARNHMRRGSEPAAKIDALIDELCAVSPLARRLWTSARPSDVHWRHRLRTPNGIITASFATIRLGGELDGLVALYGLPAGWTQPVR